MYRALSARCNYLAQDRCDIAFAAKELCREFAIPNKASYGRLKRLVRYLVGLPRLVYSFKFQTPTKQITVYCDTDFAGCQSTRRSTSGGVCLRGAHNVKHWAKTQTTVCLSSGEAELRGISDGLAQALGIQSIARDLGFSWKIQISVTLPLLSALLAAVAWDAFVTWTSLTSGSRRNLATVPPK